MGAGVEEIVRLFAGHLHLSTETARVRLDYDKFVTAKAYQDPDPHKDTGNYKKPDDLDDYSPTAHRVDPSSVAPNLIFYDLTRADPFHSTTYGPDLSGLPDGIPADFPNLGAPLLPAAPVLSIQPEGLINVTYDKGGAEYLVQVTQLNMMWDNDITVPDGWSVSALQTLQIDDIGAALEELYHEAEEVLPPEFADLLYDTASLITFAGDYDADWEATGLTTRSDVEPGLYINGVLQPEGTELPEFPAGADEEEEASEDQYPTDLAQLITAGSNVAANVATIADVNHPLGTLVVAGDFFRTDAIVQTYSYVDNDNIEYAGGGVFQIDGSGNEAFNIATFIDTDPGVPSFAGSNIFPGVDWHVDVLDGDFFDVNVVSQSNWMYDNDISVQDTYLSHYQLLAGTNEQGNFANVITIGDNYDLVIVLGDYHEINFIHQKNVLFDPDSLKVLGYGSVLEEGDYAGPTITSGGNWLHNEAIIEQWGTDSFNALTPAWEALIAQLNNGDTELDFTAGIGIPNFGDPAFNILLITGDMYDINAIKQENVVADADVLIQTVGGGIAGEDPAMQEASTGGNALGNFAAIAHTGPAADYYIGGQVYEDEMLIQTELIAADDDTVKESDPEALANELVAFTSPSDDNKDDDDMAYGPAHDSGHSDVLGNVLT